MVNTSFRLKAANNAFICCSVRLRKALIKYRGQKFFEYSFRNNIHVKISKYGVPLRAWVPCKCYCKCSIQTIFFPGRERQNLPSEMRCKNLQRSLGTKQSNWFACLKKYQPINSRGSDPDPVVCMKVRFEAKVTRGFSLSPRRFRNSLSPLRGLLLISFAKKNQEKPLGPGYIRLCKHRKRFLLLKYPMHKLN